MKSTLLNPACFSALALVLSTSLSAETSEVLHWNRVAVDATGQALPLDPMTESRILAIVHLAMHDAANTVAPHFATYLPGPHEAPGASFDAAVAAAAHETLCALLPDQAAVFHAELGRVAVPPSALESWNRGLDIGRAAAGRLLDLRRDDGAERVAPRAAGTKAGEYRPTPPDFTPAFASHWGTVRPFALRSAGQFRPTPPPAPGSRVAQYDLEVVRAIGGIGSQERTLEQSEIAAFWYEASTHGWNRIACTLAESRKLDAWQQARLLALMHVAIADGFIAGFDGKYHYYYWRPATAIRETGSPDWLSFLPTPPVPDYPSTHSVAGAAAATAIAQCLGTDLVAFTSTSGAPYANITRRFWSLSQAAQENASSRILAGLHFPSAVRAGYNQGTEVGAWAAAHVLLPREMTALTASTAR